MIKQILKSKVLAVGVLISAFIVFYSSDAFARGGHENHGHYYYNGGNWNRSWWFWGSFATGFAIGTIITKLPPYYETIYVSGVPYYYYDNVYYRSYPNGYIIVPAPTTTTAVAVPVIIQPQEISNAAAWPCHA